MCEFSPQDGSDLVAVMRRTPGAAADFAARHGDTKHPIASYEDAAQLIADPNVDAVYVAGRPFQVTILLDYPKCRRLHSCMLNLANPDRSAPECMLNLATLNEVAPAGAVFFE
jgi:hypothetical protein